LFVALWDERRKDLRKHEPSNNQCRTKKVSVKYPGAELGFVVVEKTPLASDYAAEDAEEASKEI